MYHVQHYGASISIFRACFECIYIHVELYGSDSAQLLVINKHICKQLPIERTTGRLALIANNTLQPQIERHSDFQGGTLLFATNMGGGGGGGGARCTKTHCEHQTELNCIHIRVTHLPAISNGFIDTLEECNLHPQLL